MTAAENGNWYMVNKLGMATLCSDKAGAEQEAADAQRFWPHMGPHRAVRLVEASFEAADMATASADGYRSAAAEVAKLKGQRMVLCDLLRECLPVIDALMQIPGDDYSDARLNGLAGRIMAALEVIDGEQVMGGRVMTDKQPEALRLAAWLHAAAHIYPQLNEDEPGGYASEVDQVMDEAAFELRRLHAENQALRAGYAAARLEVESLKAQLAEPVSAPESAYQRGYMDGMAKSRSDAEAAPQQGASPTAGMNIAQRILHVGGRNNAAGYVEFGSIQAVEALVRQVLRDLPAAPQQEAQEPVAVVVPCHTPSAQGASHE